MANYAYTDKMRTQKIYANADNIMQYKSVRCFCKNPKCDAKMFIYMPEHKDLAFFKASGKPSHNGACGLSPRHFSKTDYIEKDFKFPNTLLPLLNEVTENENKETNIVKDTSSSAEKRPLQGLKEIYSMLTNIDIEDSYNGYIIKDMIADERTCVFYKTKIDGYKVVECNFYKYNDEAKTITMNYPAFPHNKRFIELWFEQEELYESIKMRIKGKNHDGIVVVFGKWIYNDVDGTNYVNVLSQRQIAVIKKES